MSSSEEVSYPILKKHDVDYVLVIFGGLLGYSGSVDSAFPDRRACFLALPDRPPIPDRRIAHRDDINKFLWMVRIAQGVWPDEIQERDYFTSRGEYKVDKDA